MSNMTLWLTVGILGQVLFTARFLMQWVVSETKRASVIPTAFWWLSILGGTALLAYAIFRRDPVIIAGQAMGLFVYARNLMLVAKEARVRKTQARFATTVAGSVPLSPRMVTPKASMPCLRPRHRFGHPAEQSLHG